MTKTAREILSDEISAAQASVAALNAQIDRLSNELSDVVVRLYQLNNIAEAHAQEGVDIIQAKLSGEYAPPNGSIVRGGGLLAESQYQGRLEAIRLLQQP